MVLEKLTTFRRFMRGKDILIASFACPIGAITDRDIAWRVVSTGKSPAQTSVRNATLSDL
jgi:hypothetical protein